MSTAFSAKEPALGYYYQIIQGLVLLLSENSIPNPILSFEEMDDISIIGDNEVDVYQTKLHINSVADTSDRSTDFWKTIRVWSENISDGTLDPTVTIFTLITTATTSEGSFIHLFHNLTEDNEKIILAKMEAIATETSNATNLAGYEAFSKLTEQQKKTLIHHIRIIDSNVSIEDTEGTLKRILQYSAPSRNLSQFVDAVLGWWFRQSIDQLTNKVSFISKTSVQNYLDTCRENYRADALPDEFSNKICENADAVIEANKEIYIKQLNLIDSSKRQMRNAVNDYERAYAQRSSWLRQGLVNQTEYDTFDADLYDDWHSRHDQILDDCEGMDAKGRKNAGHEFYRSFYVDPQRPLPSFRSQASQYVTKGSYQILSNEKKIGWHPDYNNLLNDEDETVE